MATATATPAKVRAFGGRRPGEPGRGRRGMQGARLRRRRSVMCSENFMLPAVGGAWQCGAARRPTRVPPDKWRHRPSFALPPSCTTMHLGYSSSVTRSTASTAGAAAGAMRPAPRLPGPRRCASAAADSFLYPLPSGRASAFGQADPCVFALVRRCACAWVMHMVPCSRRDTACPHRCTTRRPRRLRLHRRHGRPW